MMKTIVIKYGGNAMKSTAMQCMVAEEIVKLQQKGTNIVMVHGGGPFIDEVMRKTGKEPRFEDGLRYTDEETLKIVEMVLAGRVNKELAALVHRNGGMALGLSGIDGGMITAKRFEGPPNLGFVGEITHIDARPLMMALENGYVPIVASLGTDADGSIYNINADASAAAVAEEIKAEKLIMMTDVKGILTHASGEAVLVRSTDASGIKTMIADKTISGGMIPKVKGCLSALAGGVGAAVIIDGCAVNSLCDAAAGADGCGTVITL